MSEKKNWFAKHKVLTVILVLVGLGVIGSATGSGNKSTSSGTGQSGGKTEQKKSGEKQFRFADRADKQKEDVEIVVGESASVQGLKMTALSADYKDTLSDYEKAEAGKKYLVVSVRIENTDSKTKPYNPFDFKVQTASGQVIDSTYGTVQNQLNSGDLVAGGSVTGSIVFSVPAEDGHQYVIWKPSAFDAARAIVQVN